MTKKEKKQETAEHLMEKFPEPQGMPAEWHEHDVATAKFRLMKQAEQAEKATKPEIKISEDAEKEAHLMEKFPSLKHEPENWHCTHCDDEEK